MTVQTKITGAGKAISEVYEGNDSNGNPFVNFLLRCDDGPVIRMQLWECSATRLGHHFGITSVKGSRIGFRGRLAGTYDEKPTAYVKLEDMRIGRVQEQS